MKAFSRTGKYEYDDGTRFQQIVVPLHGRKVKRVYVQQVIAILDDMFPPDKESGEDGEEENDDTDENA